MDKTIWVIEVPQPKAHRLGPIEDWTALTATKHALEYKPVIKPQRPVPKWLRRADLKTDDESIANSPADSSTGRLLC